MYVYFQFRFSETESAEVHVLQFRIRFSAPPSDDIFLNFNQSEIDRNLHLRVHAKI